MGWTESEVKEIFNTGFNGEFHCFEALFGVDDDIGVILI